MRIDYAADQRRVGGDPPGRQSVSLGQRPGREAERLPVSRSVGVGRVQVEAVGLARGEAGELGLDFVGVTVRGERRRFGVTGDRAAETPVLGFIEEFALGQLGTRLV